MEEWYSERDRLKKKKNSKENRDRIKQLQKNIYDMMYIPQYITVVMENAKDYERMFKKGFIFNGKTYKRFSCSASQARVSTIVFVTEDIIGIILATFSSSSSISNGNSSFNFSFSSFS